MPLVFKVIILIFALSSAALGNCGGEFNKFIENIKKESQEIGYTKEVVDTFFENVSLNPKVLEADRAQGIFLRPFNEFAPRLISEYRMYHGKKFDQALCYLTKRVAFCKIKYRITLRFKKL